MTIESALTALNTDIQNARTAITNKGGTVTVDGGSSQLATDIATIPSGGGSDTVPSYQIVNGALTRRTNTYNLTGTEFSNVTSIGSNGLYSAFYNCTGLIGSIDLSSVTSIGDNGLRSAFYGCTGITSVDLSSVTSIGSNGLNSAFYNCTKLQTINFDSLKTTSFGNVNAFNNMFNSSTGSEATGGCTVHFPSNMQNTISGLTGYPLFGGTSGYVTLAFDLPATS